MELTSAEIDQLRAQLQDYAPAQPAVAMLNRHHGQLEPSLEDMLAET